jgi:hypothetical protein
MDPIAISSIMKDRKLASLGDAYINLVYSMALTQTSGEPHGVKVSDRILSRAFKAAGLREYLGTRQSRKDFANASEALLIETYRKELLTINECIKIITQRDDLADGIADLLKIAVERLASSK